MLGMPWIDVLSPLFAFPIKRFGKTSSCSAALHPCIVSVYEFFQYRHGYFGRRFDPFRPLKFVGREALSMILEAEIIENEHLRHSESLEDSWKRSRAYLYSHPLLPSGVVEHGR